MRALLLVVLSIGLADSANPSTIGPALYLATTRRPERAIAGFVAGVFTVYLVGGAVLLLGPGRYFLPLVPHPGRHTVYVLELAGGFGALAAAAVLWWGRTSIERHLHRHEHRVGGSSVLLGGAIMAVELPTALPYFAAIAALVESGLSTATELALLVLFNIVFVTPLLVLLAVVQLAGERGARSLARLHDRVHRHAAVIVAAIVLALGMVLLALGGAGLAR